MTNWSSKDSLKVYNVPYWGAGFFNINDAGHVTVAPDKSRPDAHIVISDAIEQLRQQGKPVHIVDIAAGHGRYILEALEQGGEIPDSILLRDYSDINVRDGAALIEQKGLGSIARFLKGDAFDTPIGAAQLGAALASYWAPELLLAAWGGWEVEHPLTNDAQYGVLPVYFHPNYGWQI